MFWNNCTLIVLALMVLLHQQALIGSYQYPATNDRQSNRRVPAAYQHRPHGQIDDFMEHEHGEINNDDETPALYSKQNRNLASATYTAPMVNNNNNHHQPNQRPNRPNISHVDRGRHKCRIWVPIETVNKYKWASEIQKDQLKSLALIEICCDGFGPMRWAGTTICRPICKNCRNGSCEAPGVCKCYEEFVRSDNGDCVFTCPLGCLNGQCYLDGTCVCDAGYKLDESRKFCRPICSDGCGYNVGHNCTEPEVCACSKGYRLQDDGCRPTCKPHCGVGGRCIEYNRCECLPGFTLKDGVCQSDCYQICNNGYCYSRNRCICKSGFTYHEGSTQCVPV